MQLPTIWHGEFHNQEDWLAAQPKFAEFSRLADVLDDATIRTRHPFHIEAFCVVCEAIRPMRISWEYCGQANGSVAPAWTETATCSECQLNSRMRAALALLFSKRLGEAATIYASEQITPAYAHLKRRFPNTTGSEFLNPALPSGTTVQRGEQALRHEDLTSLSFPEGSQNAVITMDVFEHVPAYRKAFGECFRVLTAQGCLLFTIPFFPGQGETEVRAAIKSDGSIEHIHPPEYHGNPVGDGRSLCFQHFGWDICNDLRGAGFKSAQAHLYWGPWQGHLGTPFFVFEALKA